MALRKKQLVSVARKVALPVLVLAAIGGYMLTSGGKETAPVAAPQAQPAAAVPATPAAQAPQPVAQAPAAPAQNPIVNAFVNAGVATCAGRINQITSFLGTGENPGGVLFLPQSDAEHHQASASVEIVAPDKSVAYSSMTFTPTRTNGCDAGYDAVVWSPKKCEDIAKSQYPDKKIVGKLKQDIVVIYLDTFARVFLMPTKDGCVSIKKEVVF